MVKNCVKKWSLDIRKSLFVGISHPTKKIPNPGDKNPETRKNPTPADFSRIFEFQIPIPEILDFWDFALGIFSGFFDQDRNKK